MINFNKNSLSSLDFSNDDIENVYFNNNSITISLNKNI